MMRVKFLMDYRGHLTNERYYIAGQEAMIEDSSAAALELRGFAEILEAPKKTPTPTPEGGNHIIDATAAAIRLAAKSGLDLVAFDGKGSGENGRILIDDVKGWVA